MHMTPTVDPDPCHPHPSSFTSLGVSDLSRSGVHQHYRALQHTLTDLDASLQRTLQTSTLSSIDSRDSPTPVLLEAAQESFRVQ